jgi:hypothetical protein
MGNLFESDEPPPVVPGDTPKWYWKVSSVFPRLSCDDLGKRKVDTL